MANDLLVPGDARAVSAHVLSYLASVLCDWLPFLASCGLDVLCVDVLAEFPAMSCGRSAGLSSAELSLLGAFVLRKSSWPSVWW